MSIIRRKQGGGYVDVRVNPARWRINRLVAKVHASQLGGEHDAASDRHLQQASNPDSMFTIPAMIEVFVECVRRGFLNGLDTIRNRLT